MGNMVISDKARRLGETILVCFVVIMLTGFWMQGIADNKADALLQSKRTQVATIARALALYQAERGGYPPVVNGLPFCEPFEMYQNKRCLGELLGSYLHPDAVMFDQYKFVYMNNPDRAFIAADIPADVGVATTNRCLINDFEFWCIKLPK